MKLFRILTSEFIFEVEKLEYVVCYKNDDEETLLLAYNRKCPNVVATGLEVSNEYKKYVICEAEETIEEVMKWSEYF